MNIWTKKDLKDFVKEKFSDEMFIVVSNRQPYVHSFEHGNIVCHRTPGGVVTAIDPIMKACGGTWVAYGNGPADRKVSDSDGCLMVPEKNPSYTLKRLWLNKQEAQGYYYGFSNEALWPLCHTAFRRPVFRQEDWEQYVAVNRRFAQAVADIIKDKKAFVWIQDYHFCLLAKFLRELLPQKVFLAHFWHIPFPSHEIMRICPYKNQIIEGLLSNDLLGFHIQYHCNNFIDHVNRDLECKIDIEKNTIVKGGHETFIRPYPISIDFEEVQRIASDEHIDEDVKRLTDEFNLQGLRVLVGIDRIDYTKGIPERLLAIDRLFEKYPEFKEKIVFLQMGAVSRIHLEEYKRLNDDLNALVEQINWKHGQNDWSPIVMVRRQLSLKEVITFYKKAEVCVVSSLHDGMNLVAKEYIASCVDHKGMLVLSRFAGASRELTDAVLVNPYDREDFAEGLKQALIMPEKECRERMTRMRSMLETNNVYSWAAQILTEMKKIEETRG